MCLNISEIGLFVVYLRGSTTVGNIFLKGVNE
jgi:hypothetical protein